MIVLTGGSILFGVLVGLAIMRIITSTSKRKQRDFPGRDYNEEVRKEDLYEIGNLAGEFKEFSTKFFQRYGQKGDDYLVSIRIYLGRAYQMEKIGKKEEASKYLKKAIEEFEPLNPRDFMDTSVLRDGHVYSQFLKMKKKLKRVLEGHQYV